MNGENLEHFIDNAKNCKLDDEKMRVDIWKILLGIFPSNNLEEIKDSLFKQREEYAEICERFKPKTTAKDHPLSKSTNVRFIKLEPLEFLF